MREAGNAIARLSVRVKMAFQPYWAGAIGTELNYPLSGHPRRWNWRIGVAAREWSDWVRQTPKVTGRLQCATLSVADKVDLDSSKLRTLLFFSLLVLCDTSAKAKGMLAIESLWDSGPNAFGLRVIEHHPSPGGSLQNCPMNSCQLKHAN